MSFNKQIIIIIINIISIGERSDFAHNALMEALNWIELRCANADSLDDYLVLRI
jgi:hypothetical protein